MDEDFTSIALAFTAYFTWVFAWFPARAVVRDAVHVGAGRRASAVLFAAATFAIAIVHWGFAIGTALAAAVLALAAWGFWFSSGALLTAWRRDLREIRECIGGLLALLKR